MTEVLLSDEERQFIFRGVEEDFRTDGRGCDDYRLIQLECGLVSNTNGSARLRVGHTDILVGVKAETVSPQAHRPNEGCVEVFVDCSANATPLFEGHGGEDLASDIATVTEHVVTQGLDLKSLCILAEQQVWLLHIDAVVLECGGNIFDTVCAAVYAALHNTRIPAVTISGGDGEPMELEISDDPYDCQKVNTADLPLLVTLNKIGNCYVTDASLEEESCCDARLMAAVDRQGQVCFSRKSGPGGLEPQMMFDMLEKSKTIASSLLAALTASLEQSDAKGAGGMGASANTVGFLG